MFTLLVCVNNISTLSKASKNLALVEMLFVLNTQVLWNQVYCSFHEEEEEDVGF